MLPPPSSAHRHRRSPLTRELIALAGTPDDSPHLDDQLVLIAQLSADLVAAVSYASITAWRGGAVTTVAASSDVAAAVDLAQYADDCGPCLLALDAGRPVAVPELAATMAWPGFRDIAYGLGLRASLSIPLVAGRGICVAALNLYGRDPAEMAPLTAAVWVACDAAPPGDTAGGRGTDEGAAALVAGLVGALEVQALIQRAIGAVLAAGRMSVDAAYHTLRLRAADTGETLVATASAVLAETRS